MNELLEELGKEIQNKNSFLFRHLKDGIDKENNILFDHCLYKEKLVCLYKWHNGTSGLEELPLNRISLLTLGVFFDLNTVLRFYEDYCLQNQYWQEGLIPILGSGDADFYLIDTNRPDNEVYLYSLPLLITEPECVSLTLENFLKSICECYSYNAYSITSDGFEVDEVKEKSIFCKHNPGLSYWQ